MTKAEKILANYDSYYIAENTEKERVVISYESAIEAVNEALCIHNASGSVCECCGHEIFLSKPKCEWCDKSWLYEKQSDR
jgi:hypothetical protein